MAQVTPPGYVRATLEEKNKTFGFKLWDAVRQQFPDFQTNTIELIWDVLDKRWKRTNPQVQHIRGKLWCWEVSAVFINSGKKGVCSKMYNRSFRSNRKTYITFCYVKSRNHSCNSPPSGLFVSSPGLTKYVSTKALRPTSMRTNLQFWFNSGSLSSVIFSQEVSNLSK